VPTNQQRREAERRRLQRQLEERRAREIARRRATLIGSIVGTLVVIAAVIVVVVVSTGGSGKKNTAAGDTATNSPTPRTSASSATSTAAAQPAAPAPTAPCAATTGRATATFKGVTVSQATNLKKAPKVTAKSTAAPVTLECADLVVGKGKPASPSSTVAVQYTGVLYQNGKQFDSSWTNGGKPVTFPLTGVVPGFTQGIGGAGKVAPMRVGGRRIMILPASLGYGAAGQGTIPPNAPLVFVVDLTSVSG
jgi:FKBP-type peptidyl-prolyl cis-trans isomerase